MQWVAHIFVDTCSRVLFAFEIKKNSILLPKHADQLVCISESHIVVAQCYCPLGSCSHMTCSTDAEGTINQFGNYSRVTVGLHRRCSARVNNADLWQKEDSP